MATRQWGIYLSEFETEEAFRDAVAGELARVENIGHRMGGALIATPIRVEVPLEERTHPQVREHVTQGWVFSHEMAPAVRPAQPAAPPEDPEPDELEAALVAAGDA